MFTNEKGSVFLSVLIIFSIFCFMIDYRAEEFISDKKFYRETESRLILEHLLLLAQKDTAELTLSEIFSGMEGIFFYPRGDVYYKIIELRGDTVSFLLYATSIYNGKAKALYDYNVTKRKITKWNEY